MHFNFAVTKSQNHSHGMTEGHGKSSIVPLFQSMAIIISWSICTKFMWASSDSNLQSVDLKSGALPTVQWHATISTVTVVSSTKSKHQIRLFVCSVVKVYAVCRNVKSLLIFFFMLHKCPKISNTSFHAFLSFFLMQISLKLLSGMANSVDPDPTAPEAVRSGSALFA